MQWRGSTAKLHTLLFPDLHGRHACTQLHSSSQREWKESAGCGISQTAQRHSWYYYPETGFLLSPGMTHASQLRLYELHKCVAFIYREPSARCRPITVCQEDSAGLRGRVGLKKPFGDWVWANLGHDDTAKPWLLTSNKVWSLCNTLHNTNLPAFSSTQITKGGCALSEVPLPIQFVLLKFHCITFITGKNKVPVALKLFVYKVTFASE